MLPDPVLSVLDVLLVLSVLAVLSVLGTCQPVSWSTRQPARWPAGAGLVYPAKRMAFPGRLVLKLAAYLLLGALLAVLYLHGIADKGFWEDEIYTARDIGIASQDDNQPDFRLSFTELTYRNDNHPPLYFWVMAQWSAVLGFTELSARGFSVLWLALTLVVVARMAAVSMPEYGWAGFWAAAVFGTSSTLFVLAREARMYTMALFFVAASLSLFVSLARKESAPKTLLLALANLLGLYTHYYVVFFYAAEVAVMLWLVLFRRASRTVLAVLLVPGLLFAAWLPQLLRQRERKYESGLWIIGPQDQSSFLGRLYDDGVATLSRLFFGSTFELPKLVLVVLLAAVCYWLVGRALRRSDATVRLLVALSLVAYALLVANDLFHHTLTLTRTKYLFFLIPPLLLIYVRLAAANLAMVKVVLLSLIIGYNLAGIARDRYLEQHPDWRAISREAERSVGSLPLIVPDDDYFLCMSYYYKDRHRIQIEDWVSVYPEDFWYLVLYLQWNPGTQKRVGELEERFQVLERVSVDRFTSLVRYRVRGSE